MLLLKTGWVFCKKEKETCKIIVQFLEQEICKCDCTSAWGRSVKLIIAMEVKEMEQLHKQSQENMGNYDKYLNCFLISKYRIVSLLFFF